MQTKHPSRIVVLALAWYGISLGLALSQTKPNVLLIIVDDLNDWVGCLDGH